MREAQENHEQQTSGQNTSPGNYGPEGAGKDDDRDYVDRSLIDFDPADGLYSGTAVDGTSEIPGAQDREEGEDSGGPE